MVVKKDNTKSTIAVITGDIVNSKDIRDNNRVLLLDSLKEAFHEINKTLLDKIEPPFEIFRGDSFQAIIKKPELSLLIGILIRSKLRSIKTGSSNNENSVRNNYDARIAVGIGSIDFIAEKTIESDGQAFQFSGNALDSMKNTEIRLKIVTPWDEVNAELEVECTFADEIISEWSVFQAEAFYWHLLENKTQKELAEKFNIEQPSLRKRLVTGKVKSFELLKKRYENLILSKL